MNNLLYNKDQQLLVKKALISSKKLYNRQYKYQSRGISDRTVIAYDTMREYEQKEERYKEILETIKNQQENNDIKKFSDLFLSYDLNLIMFALNRSERRTKSVSRKKHYEEIISIFITEESY